MALRKIGDSEDSHFLIELQHVGGHLFHFMARVGPKINSAHCNLPTRIWGRRAIVFAYILKLCNCHVDWYCPFSDNCQVKFLILLPFSMSFLKKCIHFICIMSLVQVLKMSIGSKTEKVKSLESLWSVNIYYTIHIPNKADAPSFSRSKRNSTVHVHFNVQCKSLGAMRPFCLLYPASWPVRLITCKTPVDSLAFWLRVQLMMKHGQD